jgi:hypothetical protein
MIDVLHRRILEKPLRSWTGFNKICHRETEFDVWCRSLAKQLNKMETWRALNLQMQIQSLVSKERIAYERQNFFSSGNAPPSGLSTYQPPVWPYNENQQSPPLAVSHPTTELQPVTIENRSSTSTPHVEEDSLESFISSMCSSSDSM